MNKDIAVIKAFAIPMEANELETLKTTHKYISDKLILDAINGIKIVATDINNVSKSRTSFLTRTFDSITGKGVKRQNFINENIIEGINACTSWLCDHDRHISRIDNRIIDIVNELDRTQDEILKFYEQHRVLKINVDNLKDSFFSFKESSLLRMNTLENWIKDIDIRDRAYNLIDREFEALKAGQYKDYNTSLQIYTILDNIKSGDGGLYYHNIKNYNEKNEFIDYTKNKLKNFIQDNFDKDYLEEFISFENLITETNKLDSIQKDAISFISTQHYNTMIEQKLNPQISDLISIVSSYNVNEVKDEIQKQSNISYFLSYNNFIDMSTQEHFEV